MFNPEWNNIKANRISIFEYLKGYLSLGQTALEELNRKTELYKSVCNPAKSMLYPCSAQLERSSNQETWPSQQKVR